MTAAAYSQVPSPGDAAREPAAGAGAGAGAGAIADLDDAVTDAVLTTTSQLVDTFSTASITSVDGSISLPQFRLLVALRDLGPMKLTTLADHLGVKPSTSNRMVNRLVDAGLVDRRINPASRREVVLNLTDAGVGTVATVTRRRRSRLHDIVAHMPEQSRYHLVEALRAFTEAGGEPARRPAATQAGGRH